MMIRSALELGVPRCNTRCAAGVAHVPGGGSVGREGRQVVGDVVKGLLAPAERGGRGRRLGRATPGKCPEQQATSRATAPGSPPPCPALHLTN